MSQAPLDEGFVSISVRVPRTMAEQFKAIADSEFRPVAAELRRLMQERIDSASAKAA